MAMCPRCRKRFTEPLGEEGEHDCPRCGMSRDDKEPDPCDDEMGVNE